jgi:RHS repeat-associated protein
MVLVEQQRRWEYRARYYDANVGRFISEDPLRFIADLGSFYEYSYGNPINFLDSMGMTGQNSGSGTVTLDPPGTSSPPSRGNPPPKTTQPPDPGPRPPAVGPEPGFPWWPGIGALTRAGLVALVAELALAPPTARDEDLLPGGRRDPVLDKCKHDADCEAEWVAAIEMCRELLSRPHPPRGLTGGHKDVMNCARGLVSEACGGNPVDHGNKK